VPECGELCRGRLPLLPAGGRGDLEAIGIDPADLAGEFVVRFQAALEAVGFEPLQTRRLMARLAAATSPA
jgi:hypothetical protein